jgi:hypothetical protein
MAKSSPSNSREAELLICCATSTLSPARTARLQSLIEAGVDWQRVAHLAQLQGVMPLVYRYVTTAMGDALPAAALTNLRPVYHGNAVRNLSLARELVRITTLLDRIGGEPIAIKGPALAIAAYAAVTMRQFTDLDLLVREAAMPLAVETLLHAGYSLRAGSDLADLRRSMAYELAMTMPGALGELDIHWRLIPAYFPLALDGEDLWRDAVRVELEGGALRTLGPADHLLFICAHGAKHGWEALGGISDLAELIKISSIDWHTVSRRAERAGARRALALGLLLAHDLLEAPVPACMIEYARYDRAVTRAARSFINYVNDPGNDGPGFYQRWSVPLRIIEEPRARLRYLLARALTPSADDRELLRLPAPLYFLYYLVRPVRVAVAELSTALRALRGILSRR